MKTTRTFFLVLAAAVAGCTDTSSLVAPPGSGARSDAVQSTTTSDTVNTELKGVYTFGSGN